MLCREQVLFILYDKGTLPVSSSKFVTKYMKVQYICNVPFYSGGALQVWEWLISSFICYHADNTTA